VGTAGFPNLFMVTGPRSPPVFSNVVVSIEQHVEWIRDCLTWLDAHGQATIEPTEAAQDEWMAHVTEVANGTLFPRADSWYVGANIPGKPRGFTSYVGGCGTYRARCDAVAAADYTGFTVGLNRAAGADLG
jgi:cyclohexanone monooxygenase